MTPNQIQMLLALAQTDEGLLADDLTPEMLAGARELNEAPP